MKDIVISYDIENGFVSKWVQVKGGFIAPYGNEKIIKAPEIDELPKNATYAEKVKYEQSVERAKSIMQDKFEHFNEFYFAYNEQGEFVEEQVAIHQQAVATRVANNIRKKEIELRLKELSEDFIQVQLGAVFEDIEDRRAEFKSLHNELRELLGLEPREYE